MAADLRQIRFLAEAARCGSISAAARGLYISQPAVTAALRQLEGDVGAILLTRHRHGVALTAAGEAFVSRAQPALDCVEEATRAARRVDRNTTASRLTIGLLPATFSTAAQTVVKAFQKLHPAIDVRTRELSYIGHTRDLITGHVDVAFLWSPYDEPGLHFHPLTDEARVVGAADSHPLSDRDTVAVDDLLDLVYPGFHPASSGGWFQRWFVDDHRGAPAATTDDEAATPFEMALVVAQGRAIAPAAAGFASMFPAPGVRWIPITDAPPATMALAWNPRNPSLALDVFMRTARSLDSIELATRNPARDARP